MAATRRRPSRRPWGAGALLATVLAAGVGIGLEADAAPAAIDPATAQTLIAAVEAAAALDLYNARCRSDQSGRHTDNLNKELVGKLRITVTSVQDDLFPEPGYRRVQQRLQEQFVETLRAAGGCAGAKESGLPQTLRARLDRSLDALETLP